MLRTLVFSLFLFQVIDLYAAEIRGKVSDAQTGEPLIGVVIHIPAINKVDVTGMEGTFVLRDVSYGDYEIEISYIGYARKVLPVTVNSTNRVLILNVTMETEDHMMGEVVVVSRAVLNTEYSARQSEKNALNIINVVSSQSIEMSPDITVANVMQRVSGVSLERNHTGDGQHAIIRGMDKRYNYSLVNGIKIPSPDNDNRYVPLDIFPADLLDRMEVTKALTPDMEGDAIGGAINMRLRDAPTEFTIRANAGTGFNTIFLSDLEYTTFDHSVVQKESPVRTHGTGYLATIDDFTMKNADFITRDFQPLNQIYGLSMGNRFGKNKRLGVLISGSYQNTSRGSNSTFFHTSTNRETNIPTLSSVTISKRSIRQARSGIHGKIDYRINNRNTVDFYSSYINLHEYETRNMVDTNLVIGRAGFGTGRIEQWNRTRQRISTIYTNNLSGRHQLAPRLSADWSAVYSYATYRDPDMSEYMTISGISRDENEQLVQTEWLYDNTGTRGFWRRWRGNSDKDFAGYGNIAYTPHLFNREALIKVGGMYRMKQRDNYFDRYRLYTDPARQEWHGSVLDNTFTVVTPGGTTQNALNYELDEIIYAYYGMVRFEPYDKLQITAGVRTEHTEFNWLSNAPANVEGKDGNISYVDILPSIHFNYRINGDQNLRLSYFEAINRQGYFEIIPYQIYEEDQFRQAGNPNLNRAFARNIDARYEIYPGKLDKFTFGVFYKYITDPIEYTVVRRQDLGNNVFLSPGNFGNAQNYGFEFDFTKYFNRFGVRGNYTFTQSEITTDKFVYYRNDDGMLTNRIEQQTRPLQGQSKHIGNLSLLYNDARRGTNAQLAFVYTGDRIAFVSNTFENDQWQKAMSMLDFSFEQRVFGKVVLYLKINNLLNTPYELEIRKPNSHVAQESKIQTDPNRILTRLDYFQRTVLVGAKYNL